jgi:hypothetical protein
VTVVSAILTRSCIAIASDSYITRLRAGNRELVPELIGPKIVRFDRIRAAAAFWGLAELDGVSTYDWLRSVASTCQGGVARPTLAELAELLCEDLRPRLLARPYKQRGIGIHLAGYERVKGYRVPEPFLITNWQDESYIKRQPLDWKRRSHFDVFRTEPASWKHNPDSDERLRFRELLEAGGFYTVNNGDPVMFNPAASATYEMLQQMVTNRRASYSDSPATWGSLATLPIQIVRDFQQGTHVRLKRAVGGQIHNVVIPKTGEPTSTSGVPAS